MNRATIRAVGIAIVVLAAHPAAAAAQTPSGVLSVVENFLRGTRSDYKAVAPEAVGAGVVARNYGGFGVVQTTWAATVLAAQPSFQGSQDQLTALVRDSADLAVVWGVPLPAAAAFLAGAMAHPTLAADVLQVRQMPTMTRALRDTIHSAEASGDAASGFGLLLSAVTRQVGGAAGD